MIIFKYMYLINSIHELIFGKLSLIFFNLILQFKKKDIYNMQQLLYS